jgi:hypothetical protein
VIDISSLPSSYETLTTQPIWLSQVIDAQGSTHYFANNAELLGYPKTYDGQLGKSQLVKIDEVITPLLFLNNRAPTPLELINKPQIPYGPQLQPETVSPDFARLIASTRSEYLFNTSSEMSTFFIPLESIGNGGTSDLLRAHVVPGKALFLRPWALQSAPVVSALSDARLQAQLYLEQPTLNMLDNTRLPVVRAQVHQSSAADSNGEPLPAEPQIGNTYSQVVIPNLMFPNAVVHFVNKPLTRASFPLSQLIAILAESKLSRFFAFARNRPDFLEQLAYGGSKTLFAFTDAAFERVAEQFNALNASAQEQILYLHYSSQKALHSSQIIAGRSQDLPSQSSISNGNLKATLENVGQEKWLYVEGGGVKARAVEANILGTCFVIKNCKPNVRQIN